MNSEQRFWNISVPTNYPFPMKTLKMYPEGKMTVKASIGGSDRNFQYINTDKLPLSEEELESVAGGETRKHYEIYKDL